jgi:hypothetical protein
VVGIDGHALTFGNLDEVVLRCMTLIDMQT